MSAQQQAFRKLIRIAARVMFLGDVNGVTREVPSVEEERSRAKRNQIDQKDLVVVVVDALSVREWVSVDKFAEQIHMSAKQVRRVLHYLENQGFVVREHRREKRKGNRVESVDDPFAPPEKGQTSSYVAIDYPHFFDMLRLRMHLAKKALDDKVDDKAAVKKYVCGPDSEQRPGCGAKYTSFTVAGLQITEKGLLRCNVCDFGIVEPEIAGKSAASWRLDRDIARSQRRQLKEVFRELEGMIEKLKDVDPPDFGSFTDWVQAKKAHQKSGSAAAGTRQGGGGGRGGALDYGIDGPLSGDMSIRVTHDGESGIGQGLQLQQAQAVDPRTKLPYFMQQDPTLATSRQNGAHTANTTQPASDAAKMEAVDNPAEAAAEQQAVYAAYVQQYMAQVAAIQAQQVKTESDDTKDWKPGDLTASPAGFTIKEDPGAGDTPPLKRPKLEHAATDVQEGFGGAKGKQAIPPPSPADMALPSAPNTPAELPAETEVAFDWEETEPVNGRNIPTPEEAFDWEET